MDKLEKKSEISTRKNRVFSNNDKYFLWKSLTQAYFGQNLRVCKFPNDK